MAVANTVKFGFLTRPVEITWSGGTIGPLENHAEITTSVTNHERHYNGWYHMPIGPCGTAADETKNPPHVAMPFALPATHRLTLNADLQDDQSASFFIALFGFLHGLRLQRENWRHLMRCPTKIDSLNDFSAQPSQVKKTLELATTFWRHNQSQSIRDLAFGALHWHLFAQLYAHDFERFSAQYTALDTCWRLAEQLQIHTGTKTPHAQRAKALANRLGLPVPSWAEPLEPLSENPKKMCALSRDRNNLIHEAMYADAPVGFAATSEHFTKTTELTNFVARCWLALLGVRNEYTRSEVSSMQLVGFSFDTDS